MSQLGAQLAADLTPGSCSEPDGFTERECITLEGVWTEGGSESHRDIRDVQYIGVGKSMFHAHLAAITEGSTAAFVEDPSFVGKSMFHPTWTAWGAEQRDIFVLDRWGRLVYKENVTPGFDAEGLRRAILAALDATEHVAARVTSGAPARVAPSVWMAMVALLPVVVAGLGVPWGHGVR